MGKIGSSERLDWPTAVVVGAGGLGMAVARRLGQSHRLLLADRDGEHAVRQCAQLLAEGHDAEPVTCDVTGAEAVARLAAAASARPQVRTLAHVVGLSPAAQDFNAILSVNLVGAARIASSFADVLQPGGAAVFIASSSAHMKAIPPALRPILDEPLSATLIEATAKVLGKQADPAHAYIYSKAGLIRMCVRLAGEWGKRGLRIVSLSPGLIATPQGAEAYKYSSTKTALYDAVPLGRECSMLEISGVVDFLASDQASYISGTDILVDGGLIAHVVGDRPD